MSVQFQDISIFHRQKHVLSEEASEILQYNDEVKYLQVMILIEDRDKFDHFTFDSPQYSPFYNDERVIVSNSNAYLVESVAVGHIQDKSYVVVLRQDTNYTKFDNYQEELKSEIQFLSNLDNSKFVKNEYNEV